MVFLGKDRGDKSYQAKLEAKMKGVSDARFVFLEHLKQETIFELFKRASLVVMTPHSDGSPVSAIEAMIAKVPVILPPLDYDEEVFGNVFKLKSWDAQDLSDLILTILTDKHDVSAQINRAYASALSYGNFNIEMVKILKLYEQLNPVIK
jgi:glycosyltransferase involved in cell wall biosynthesis